MGMEVCALRITAVLNGFSDNGWVESSDLILINIGNRGLNSIVTTVTAQGKAIQNPI